MLYISLEVRNIIGPILGLLISTSSILTYVPQFCLICKKKSVNGINELSLLIMNIALMCLTMNSVIFNWNNFSCNNVRCFLNLFPFIQITISWIMVLIFYIIFITFKFRNNTQRIKSGLSYIITYLIFTIFIISLSIGEKFGNKHPDKFFLIFGNILGYTSAVGNGLVWLPQIYTLYKNKHNGNLSILMFALQAPGNLIIIIFQAVIYLQPVSTWITYVITLVEQSIILYLMIIYRTNKVQIIEIKDMEQYREIENVLIN